MIITICVHTRIGVKQSVLSICQSVSQKRFKRISWSKWCIYYCTSERAVQENIQLKASSIGLTLQRANTEAENQMFSCTAWSKHTTHCHPVLASLIDRPGSDWGRNSSIKPISRSQAAFCCLWYIWHHPISKCRFYSNLLMREYTYHSTYLAMHLSLVLILSRSKASSAVVVSFPGSSPTFCQWGYTVVGKLRLRLLLWSGIHTVHLPGCSKSIATNNNWSRTCGRVNNRYVHGGQFKYAIFCWTAIVSESKQTINEGKNEHSLCSDSGM